MHPLSPVGVVGALAGLCMWFVLLTSVVRTAWWIARRRVGPTAPVVGSIAVDVVGLAALSLVPRLAGPWAEHANGWVDRDGNGILDPLANGGYDWVDVNGGAFLRYAGGLSCLVVVAVVGSHLALRRLTAASAVPPPTT